MAEKMGTRKGKAVGTDAPADNSDIRRSLEYIENQLEFIGHRVGTIERVQIATNADRVIEDIGNTLGGSSTRAYIVHVCAVQKSNAELQSLLGITRQATDKHTRMLVKGDLLSLVRVAGQKHFCRTPLCDKINFDKVFRNLIAEYGDGNNGA